MPIQFYFLTFLYFLILSDHHYVVRSAMDLVREGYVRFIFDK